MRPKQIIDIDKHVKKVVLEPKPKEPTLQEVQQKILDKLQQINQRLDVLAKVIMPPK